MKRFAGIPPFALLLALFLLPASAEAKSGGRITGKVLTPEGRALFGAVVTIFKEDRDGGTILYTHTDRRGEYNFGEVNPGNYSLHVNHEGFKPLVKPNLQIGGGKTTTLNVILLDLLNFISADDPRNWGVATVLRSTSDRRLIFRASDDTAAGTGEVSPRFERGAAINMLSATALDSRGYSVFPSSGFNGLTSNFAYSEPVSQNARMVFAGQLSAGCDSLWMVHNIFQYHPQTGRDMKFSLGYGRQNLVGTSLGTINGPARFFALDPSIRDSGIETLALGFAASDRFLDAFVIEYGFDLSRVRQGSTKSVLSPHFRLAATPVPGWTFTGALASRRISDSNSVVLPDGEFINLMEPVFIAKINGELSLSQFKHSEIGVEKNLDMSTALDLALYEDRMEGPGIPLALTINTSGSKELALVQLREDQTRQRGARFGVNRRFMDSIASSVSYVYARGSSFDHPPVLTSSKVLVTNLPECMQLDYFHSLMGSVNARIARTKTDLTASLRWHGGNPATPIDLFADRMDTQGKGFAFHLRQLIPMPDFLYGAGQWIALIDMRNMFDQGRYVISTPDGVIILTPNPRHLRFGLNLSFN